MMTIYLVPVGATGLSNHGELLGLNNPPLSDSGRSNAMRISEALKPIVLEAVFSGSYSRETETAELIAAPHHIPVRTEKDVRDINYGRWSGQSWEDIEIREADVLSKLINSPHKFKFPSGEKMKHGGKRMQTFVRHLLANYGVGNIVVVADDFVIMLIVSMIAKVRLDELDPFKPSLGKMTVIECDQGVCKIKNLRTG